MDRYGDQIESDFAHYYHGLDVVDVLRVVTVDGRRRRKLSLRKFRVLVNGLPPWSATQAERADDDEMVSDYLDYLDANPELKKELEAQGKRKPTMYGYTTTDQKLDRLTAEVVRVVRLVDGALSGGKNTKNLPPIETPETAADRWRRRQSKRRIDAIVAEVREAQARWVPPAERAKRN